MKLKRVDLLLITAAVVLCAGTCVVAKLTTPPFEPAQVTYHSATAATSAVTATTAVQTVQPFDLNTVSKEELLTVSGIGEAMAERIIAYREQNGGFNTVDELLFVSGVGQKRLEQWRPFFYVAAE